QLREMNAVPLAPGEILHRLLLVRTLEVERGDVGARGDAPRSQLDQVLAAGDLLPYGLRPLERLARLIHVRELHRVAEAERAAVRLPLARDPAEERGLAGAVRADDADDAAGREAKGEVLDQGAVAVALREIRGLDHQIPEPRPRGDRDLGDLAPL